MPRSAHRTLKSLEVGAAAVAELRPHPLGSRHVDEQWPGYWASRFEARGFAVFDVIRPRVWDDDQVLWWYAQNTLLFVHRDSVPLFPGLAEMNGRQTQSPLALIHPCVWTDRARFCVEAPPLMFLLKNLPRSAWNAILRRAKSLDRPDP